jgi:transcriptional regulator with XRE-family HTH domain
MSEFAKRIRDWRRGRGLSQKQAAGRLGVSQPTVASWELGTGTPSITNVKRVSKVLRVPIATVLQEVDDAALARAAQ